MNKGTKTKLIKSLFAAKDGGIAINPNAGKHMNVALDKRQTQNVQFPLETGSLGVIVDLDQTSVCVEYQTRNHQTVYLRFKKDGFNFFNLIVN